MPANPADSAIFRDLFGDAEVERLFSDTAQIRAMLLVEGALARVQGAAGVIPAEAAAYIDRASVEVQIDPRALGAETLRNGVPVPGFLSAFRKAAGAPEMMQYLHWGATSQDIMDTAQALRLRRLLDLWEARLGRLLARLGELAAEHAETPMAGRTYGQLATPTSFGAVVASWGRPLLDWRGELAPLRGGVEQVSLSGAAGTAAALGPKAAELRAALAKALGLGDPGHSWHSERAGLGRLAGFAGGLAASLGKLAEDVLLLTQSDVAEIALQGGGGGSSTMPQKQNPVMAAALLALMRQVMGLAATLQSAGVHRQQRDGAAWFLEWLTLAPLCVALSRGMNLALDLAQSIRPQVQVMERALAAEGGGVLAEAISFRLAERMARPEAQAKVAEMCREAQAKGLALVEVLAVQFPDLAQLGVDLGQAPNEARAFGEAVATTLTEAG